MTAAMTSGAGEGAGRRIPTGAPPLLQQYLDVRVAQRPKLVDETDAGEELRVSCNAFLDARHTDEDHAKDTFIGVLPPGVAAQVACTLVLLIVTLLTLRSLSHLLREDRGFDSTNVTLAQADLFAPQYDNAGPKGNAARLAFADRALTALGRLPGVQSVALTSVTPLTGETWVDNLFRPDHPVPAGQEPMINVRWINPDYLPTMQSPLVAGRNITAIDRANPYVALISERTARTAFPGENPIGRKICDIVPNDVMRAVW
jgi:hypothetical protein